MKLRPRDTCFGVLHALTDVEMRVAGEKNAYSVFRVLAARGGTEGTDGDEYLFSMYL